MTHFLGLVFSDVEYLCFMFSRQTFSVSALLTETYALYVARVNRLYVSTESPLGQSCVRAEVFIVYAELWMFKDHHIFIGRH